MNTPHPQPSHPSQHPNTAPNRPQTKFGPDYSRWTDKLDWHEAQTTMPVEGHIVLVADREGCVNVMDLRSTPTNPNPTTKTKSTAKSKPTPTPTPYRKNESSYDRTKKLFKKHMVKWWTYLPISPPLNVAALQFDFNNNKLPAPTPDQIDPPRSDWVMAYNQPHDIITP